LKKTNPIIGTNWLMFLNCLSLPSGHFIAHLGTSKPIVSAVVVKLAAGHRVHDQIVDDVRAAIVIHSEPPKYQTPSGFLVG
jgi:hypothetical protein